MYPWMVNGNIHDIHDPEFHQPDNSAIKHHKKE